jgi:hypothetical protein
MNLSFFHLRSRKTRVTLFMLAIFMLGEQQFATATGIARQLNEDLADRMLVLQTIARDVTPTHHRCDSGAWRHLFAGRPRWQCLSHPLAGVYSARNAGAKFFWRSFKDMIPRHRVANHQLQ